MRSVLFDDAKPGSQYKIRPWNVTPTPHPTRKPAKDLSRRRFAAILCRERWGREGFTFWLDSQQPVRKSNDAAVSRRETLKPSACSRPGIQSESVCMCMYKSMRDGFLSLRAASLLLWRFALVFISGPPRRPGWSFWCAAAAWCATGPGGRWSRSLSPAGGGG